MISSSAGDLSSTVKSISNINIGNKACSLNNENILINIPQHKHSSLQLKNVLLKNIDQPDYDKAILGKKRDTYELQNTFKFLEYIDVRRLPINLHKYKHAVYDVVTTSKVTSHLFLEKLVKQQRHMLVYSKSCGKYLILYYSFPPELRNGSDQTIKLIDIVDKIQMRALDISLPKMLVDIYKNIEINIDEKYLNKELHEEENDENYEGFGYPEEPQMINEPDSSVNNMKAEIFMLNSKIDGIMKDNEELKRQNQEIKKQNELIIQLLRGKVNT